MFWLGAAVALCYIPGITGAYIATQWPLLSIVLPVMLLFRSAPFTVFHALGALFVAYAAARFYFPLPTYDGAYGLWLVVIMALCAWFGSTLTNARDLYAGLRDERADQGQAPVPAAADEREPRDDVDEGEKTVHCETPKSQATPRCDTRHLWQ